MLTVDYDTLGLRAGDLLLDLGCGFGRHAFEGLRRGADIVACDMAHGELVEVRSMFGAMHQAGDIPTGSVGATTQGDATRLPFADGSFDRIIASEVMEHIPDDVAALDELTRVLRPGGTMAITVPAWLPEKVCWALSSDYHAPVAVGGHVRIYTEHHLRTMMRAAGLEPGATTHAHALHSPYWWLRCAVGPTNDANPLVKAYHKLLVWDIEKQPAVTRVAERLLAPLVGKSVVLYARKPAHAPVGADSAAVVTANATDPESAHAGNIAEGHADAHAEGRAGNSKEAVGA